MRAVVLEEIGKPLKLVEQPIPEPVDGQIQVQVSACALCRTDLHVVDGDLSNAKPRVVPGHEIVGTVSALGRGVLDHAIGDRVGIPWLGSTCGHCSFCIRGEENLCNAPQFTGYTLDGGFAEYVVANSAYCFALPDEYSDIEVAPLLCAGLIGYRSLKMVGERIERLGICGFGAAAHIVTQVALHKKMQVYAFTRPGDVAAQNFARDLGAIWVGGSDGQPPVELDAAIIFAPVGSLVPTALKAVRKGGTVVCGGIHMSNLPQMPYEILWGERCVRSVANLTRQDAKEFLALAPRIPIRTTTETFDLADANAAIDRLRAGRLTGAAVVQPSLSTSLKATGQDN